MTLQVAQVSSRGQNDHTLHAHRHAERVRRYSALHQRGGIVPTTRRRRDRVLPVPSVKGSPGAFVQVTASRAFARLLGRPPSTASRTSSFLASPSTLPRLSSRHRGCPRKRLKISEERRAVHEGVAQHESAMGEDHCGSEAAFVAPSPKYFLTSGESALYLASQAAGQAIAPALRLVASALSGNASRDRYGGAMKSINNGLFMFCAVALSLGACQDFGSRPEGTEPSRAASTALTPASPNITTFVVYAAQSVSLGTGDFSLGGDIGVSGAGGSITVGSRDFLDLQHTLVAPSVTVGSLAVVGPVDTNALTNNGGQVGTQSPYPSAMPSLPAIFPATPGTTNVTVAQGQQTVLNPGNYGVLTDNGQVFLNPGTYSFSNVTLGNNAQIVAQPGGATSVLVATALQTGTFAQIFRSVSPRTSSRSPSPAATAPAVLRYPSVRTPKSPPY